MSVQPFLKAVVIAIAFLPLSATIHAAAADDPKASPISFVIGASPGGTYDTVGRAVARHMPQYIPGKPTMVPRNMRAASGLAMINYLYNVAPRDGTVIGLSNNTVPLLPLLGELPPNVKFDVTKLQWIGTPSQEVFVTFIRSDAPVRTVEDLRKQESFIGASGSGGNSITLPKLMNVLADTKMRLVTGYGGQNDVFLAIEKGEVQGNTTGFTNLTASKPDWLRDGKVRVLIQYAVTPIARLKDVPTALDLVSTAQDKDVIRFLISVHRIARPLVAPPEVPEGQIRMLRAAFDSTMKDAAFRSESEKLGLDIDPIDGEEISKVIQSIYATPKDTIERTRKLLQSIEAQ